MESRVLVLGGGVSGQRAALDIARAGAQVVLVEREATIGGTVAQLGTMFPQHNCLLCRGDAIHGPGCTRPAISAELLDRTTGSKRIEVRTRSRLVGIEGEPGSFRARILQEPRYVTPEKCINCNRCTDVCPKSMPSPFEAGLVTRKAAYKPADRCVPDSYAIDKGEWCEGCAACEKVCPTDAIDLAAKSSEMTIDVGAVVVATGMRLSDPERYLEYGYGRYADVFTGLELERMTSPAGPGEGRILRRSNGEPPSRIAWIQCVGSRDEEHDYCSAFCCGYATRQAVLSRRILPDAEARIYMMDDRVFARGFSRSYDPLRAQHGVTLERVRLSVITEDPETRELILQVSDESGKARDERYGMVVLSVGAEAAAEATALAETLGIESDGFGFVQTELLDPVSTSREGIYAAGTSVVPADVADSISTAGAAAARVCEFLGIEVAGAPVSEREPPGTEPASAGESARIGVFACNCAGDVGNVVDLAKVTGDANALPDVVVAQELPFGCLPEGVSAIRASAAENGLTGIVIAGCSARTFAPFFSDELNAEVEVVSIKDECAVVHRGDCSGATRKAAELIRIGVERLRALRSWTHENLGRPPEKALVVGGGLSGLTAALHLADSGIDVHLVERESHLGGHALLIGNQAEGYDVAGETADLVERVTANSKITLHLQSTVASHTAFGGVLTAFIRPNGQDLQERRFQFGATVIAVGGAEHRGSAYGLGNSPCVVTLLDLHSVDVEGSNDPVVFIGCVGPWDEPGNSTAWHCSRGCCETMLRKARLLKEASPGRQVTVLVREVNTYGFREQQYTGARRAGVLFVRFSPEEPPRVDLSKKGARILVKDQSIGEELSLDAGLLVLAAATLPRHDGERTAAALGAGLDEDGFFNSWEAKTRSVGSLEPGVFVCGLAAGPKPAPEVVAQGLAASQAALIHLLEDRLVRQDESASIEQKKCATCLTCVRVCPYQIPQYGALTSPPDWPSNKPYIDPYRCQGCGVCACECPAQAISIARNDRERAAGILGRWLPSAVPAGGVE